MTTAAAVAAIMARLRDHVVVNEDGVRQRLDTARAEITRLRAENRSLRDQIARQLGLQRIQPASNQPPDDTNPSPQPPQRHIHAAKTPSDQA